MTATDVQYATPDTQSKERDSAKGAETWTNTVKNAKARSPVALSGAIFVMKGMALWRSLVYAKNVRAAMDSAASLTRQVLRQSNCARKGTP